MAENITALLGKLIDDTRPVRSIDLTDLSDLARGEVVPFRAAWAALSEARRLDLVTTLVEQAEANIHLNFHVILRTLLDDPDARIRRAAIEGLWEDEKTNLIGTLIGLMQQDVAEEVRAAAATSLGRHVLLGELGDIGEEPARQAEEALHMTWYRAGESVEVRRRALESLAYGSMPELNALIQNAYYDEDARMRQSAVFSMGRTADGRWARHVLTELSSPEPAMRFEAAVAAGEMALRGAVQMLIRRLDDPDSNVREAATSALGKIGGPVAKRALQALAQSSDEALALAAEEALDELNFGGEHFDGLLMELDNPKAAALTDHDDEDDETEDDLGDEEALAFDAHDELDGFDLENDLFEEDEDDLDLDDDEGLDDESLDDEDDWDDEGLDDEDADDESSDDESSDDEEWS